MKAWGSGVQTPEEIRVDTTLIERIVARDASAIGELYDLHSRLLYGLILRILRDRAAGCEQQQQRDRGEMSRQGRARVHPHFESPQLRQVMQPSIMIMALVMHLLQSCALAG